MKVHIGFPEPQEGDYLLWSTEHPLPRFLRITKDDEGYNCQLMWEKKSLQYDNCVLVIRGFDLTVEFQIRPDGWDDTRHIKIPKPSLHDIEEGSPTEPGRYYLFSSQQVKKGLDAYYAYTIEERIKATLEDEEPLDLLVPDVYVEVIDYHGDLAVLPLGSSKPMKYEMSNAYYHAKVKLEREDEQQT